MPAISSSAPGKVILCGEHAVVYGQPAIALPVHQVRTKTTILARPIAPAGEVRIVAPGIHLDDFLNGLDSLHPLQVAITLVIDELKVKSIPACEIRINTSIPMAAGLGSSASVSVSMARALSQFLGHPLPDETVNRIAFEVEKIHHGTPSGIDNTVITYEVPVIFRKGEPLQHLEILNGFTLVIADSGTPSLTAETVAGVREKWRQDSIKYDAIFAKIGEIVLQVHEVLRSGDLLNDAALLTKNHQLLNELGVSTPTLDNLVSAALDSGASGAKLSGGGGGGNVIAVCALENINTVVDAFKNSGAMDVIVTDVPGTDRVQP